MINKTELLTLYKSGNHSQENLSKKYGVSRARINQIIKTKLDEDRLKKIKRLIRYKRALIKVKELK